MTTREELYAAILGDPEEVSRRLVFADWLDEQPVPRVNCPGCGGSRWKPSSTPGINEQCPCGTGTVPDTSDADRAEFIRVQCRAAEIRRDCLCGACVKSRGGGGQCTNGPCGIDRRQEDGVYLRRREAELRRLHPEWLRAECPGCAGKRVFHKGGDLYVGCPTCGGTGDLFMCDYKRIDLPNGVTRQRDTPTARTVVFRNGLIDSVGCELRELGAVTDSNAGILTGEKWRPSAWAKAVAKAFPVTRFVLAGCAVAGPTAKGDYWWVRQYPDIPRQPHMLPEVLFETLEGGRREVVLEAVAMYYPTAEAATDALAMAAGRVVRRAVTDEDSACVG